MFMVREARAMTKYCKNNHSKTLLDHLTASDIADSVVVYESAFVVWEEEFNMNDTCKTHEEKKAFKSVATLKHHVKRGSRITLFQDGQTKDGKDYFHLLCLKFDKLIKLEKVWDMLSNHWEMYTHKYHAMRYEFENGVHRNHEDETTDDDEEEDCIISLPGEMDEQGSEDDLYCEEKGVNQRNRQQIGV